MTAADRARMVDAIHTDALRLISAGIRADHGAVTPRRLRFLLLERLHGTEYAQLACSVAPDG